MAGGARRSNLKDMESEGTL
ncbi:uncharacterized protein G2W53_042379 [Senna tora]|uniref:Uncharacterized protein n=1 Tax=Senna tora TaxID=362788 RepID=A0A834VYX9_9FABA|nr:uncharacterized protein G2W53_042379 [Senna tora]